MSPTTRERLKQFHTCFAADDRVPFTLSDLEELIGDYQQFTGRAGLSESHGHERG